MYEPRWYREDMKSELAAFTVSFRETDLWVGVNRQAFSLPLQEYCYAAGRTLYCELNDYLLIDPGFLHSLLPYVPRPDAPPIAGLMAQAAANAGVGPMAAVAGAFAQEIARQLEKQFSLTDIIVENGGDIYLRSSITRRISIYAGNSILSNRLALEINPADSPLGICTSSGTVGPSLSFGNADAVTVLARDAATADAYATAIGNLVKTPADIEPALDFGATQPEIAGVVIIIGDQVGVRGRIKLV